MTLSPLAAHFAAEIAAHDWSDAPYRIDRAGHQRDHDRDKAGDTVLRPDQTDSVVTNVMWVVGQVLAHEQADFSIHEFAEACGVSAGIRLRSNGSPSGTVEAGLRTVGNASGGTRYAMPGASLMPTVRVATTQAGIEAAQCGEVRVRADHGNLHWNLSRLTPRAHVLTTFEGMAYGEGFIRRVDLRGDWYVVVWEDFWTLDRPFPCTAPNGSRNYADDIYL